MNNPGMLQRGAFTFHGSFKSKILAARKERNTPGSFIHYHEGRYYVLKPKVKANPAQRKRLAVLYRRVLSVQAQKVGFHVHCDAPCKRANHKYNHDFKTGAKLLGIPDGAVLMLKDGSRIRLSDGSMLISDREY